jgi:hypothetical protein
VVLSPRRRGCLSVARRRDPDLPDNKVKEEGVLYEPALFLSSVFRQPIRGKNATQRVLRAAHLNS